jgi:hypothetical protein
LGAYASRDFRACISTLDDRTSSDDRWVEVVFKEGIIAGTGLLSCLTARRIARRVADTATASLGSTNAFITFMTYASYRTLMKCLLFLHILLGVCSVGVLPTIKERET